MILDYITRNWMDILGTSLGLFYLVLEMKEKALMWIVGAVMPVIYVFVLYEAGIYADCAMEFYYFLAAVYGFYMWIKGRTKHGQKISIRHTPEHVGFGLTVVFGFLALVIGLILFNFTDSTVPVLDAITTSLSIIALWMLAKKYIEQWWIWLAVDVLSTGLYIYKGVYGRALLYGIYSLMVYYGYYEWKARMLQQQEERF